MRAAAKHERDKVKIELQMESLKRLSTLYDMRVAHHSEAKGFKDHANEIASHHRRIAAEGQPVPVSNRDKILERKRRLKK